MKSRLSKMAFTSMMAAVFTFSVLLVAVPQSKGFVILQIGGNWHDWKNHFLLGTDAVTHYQDGGGPILYHEEGDTIWHDYAPFTMQRDGEVTVGDGGSTFLAHRTNGNLSSWAQ